MKDNKFFLLRRTASFGNLYLFWDPYMGWQETCLWQFAYHFFEKTDALQMKMFINYSGEFDKEYKVVSRKF